MNRTEEMEFADRIRLHLQSPSWNVVDDGDSVKASVRADGQTLAFGFKKVADESRNAACLKALNNSMAQLLALPPEQRAQYAGVS